MYFHTFYISFLWQNFSFTFTLLKWLPLSQWWTHAVDLAVISDAFFLNKWSALPAFLQKLVDQDNHKFEEWCNEMADMRQQSVNKGKAKHEEVKKLYKLLPTKDGQ